MNVKTMILIGVGLYLWSKMKSPVMASVGSGLQTCAAADGTTFPWITTQICPNAVFTASNVPYTVDNQGNNIPLTY